MPRITPVHWRTFEKVLFYVGCELVREEGDHRIYQRAGLARPLVVPRYTPLPIFIIRNNLRVLGLSPREYLDILPRAKK